MWKWLKKSNTPSPERGFIDQRALLANLKVILAYAASEAKQVYFESGPGMLPQNDAHPDEGTDSPVVEDDRNGSESVVDNPRDREEPPLAPDDLVVQFNRVLRTMEKFSGTSLVGIRISEHYECSAMELLEKARLAEYFWQTYVDMSDEVAYAGSVFDHIKDSELRERCFDVLTARSNFDRVINQATLVLEHRIRELAGSENGHGIQLINQALRDGKLTVSVRQGEQEAFGNLLRGLMGFYRNSSHHRILPEVGRDEALRVLLFIDSVLWQLRMRSE